jgi:D-alanyl-D-alanine carboxypeptidase/D-alanyl-D-alanine-endopeptidase (penicillin-binding protein 4)
MRCLCFFVLVGLLASPLAAESLDRVIRPLLDTSAVSVRTNIGLRIIDVESGEVLFDQNGTRLYTPASTLKTITSAAALHRWGPDHRFSTTVGVNGTVTDGTLVGDLVIVGGGDPMMTSGDLARLAGRIASEAGIRRIQGDLVLDLSRFAPTPFGPGWMWDDDPDYYSMTVTALMVDFNVATVRVAPAAEEGAPPTAELVPAADFPAVVLMEPAVQASRPTITRRPFEEPILVTPPASQAFEVTTSRVSVLSPGPWIASLLGRALAANGVVHEGGLRVTHDGWPHEVLMTAESPALREILVHFNRVSENAVGEVLLLNMAAEDGGGPATWPAGARAITGYATSTAGLAADGIRLVDGSGLSRYNLLTAEGFTTLLRHEAGKTGGTTLREVLPIIQVAYPEGYPADAPRDRVRAKTGGMGGVNGLVGYITTIDGRELAFAWLANGFIGPAAPVVQLRDEILGRVVAWPSKP